MKNLLLIFVSFSWWLISCKPITQENTFIPNQTAQDEWSCISTFDDFLYQMVKINREDDLYNLPANYPSFPWEVSIEIPESVFNNFRTEIELARISSGQAELWIRSGVNLIKHTVENKNFSIISAFPYDESGMIYKDVEIRDLFETVTGNIVGVNFPLNNDTVWGDEIPLFSIYNEAQNKFNFYDIGLKYREKQVGFGYVEMIPRYGVIIARSGSLIWIYQQQDGLYSYDPMNSELRHYETSFDGVVQRMIVSQDGFLLFSQKKGDFLKLSHGELVKYYPTSQTSEEITIPFPRWPDYGTLLSTKSGDLWLGIHGYMSKDGSWVLRNPDRFAYINIGATSETYNWQQPNLLFQSSNGYLWYTNESWDGLGVDGSAWYDPASGTGCWFTTESRNIVEDDNKNLWMVIDEKIYRYIPSQ